MKELRPFHEKLRSQRESFSYERYGVILARVQKMLILSVKLSESEINFQRGFMCPWVVLALKMAYRAREGVLGGVSDSKLVHLP